MARLRARDRPDLSDGCGAGTALLGPSEIRRLAGQLGLSPSKRLGQNFLHDANTARRIARSASLDPSAVVLEIGPGLGSLTLALLPRAQRLLAVEIDPVLAGALPETVAGRAPEHAGRLRVLTADALHTDREQLVEAAGTEPTALVANLPYNVAVPVLLHLLAVLPSLRRGLVLVQAEVADRLAARPGSRVYGVPSVKAAWFADVARAGAVPRPVFWPVPHVDSGLVTLTRRAPPAGADRAAVFAVIDAAFAQRRKTVRSALAGWAGGAERCEQILRAAGIGPTSRAEQLGIADFARIAQQAAG